MTDPRQLFVWLGFLAQALTWDSYWFVAGVTVLWILAVTVLKGRWPVTLKTEGLARVLGCGPDEILVAGQDRGFDWLDLR